jgi:hypothetical protein
LLIAPETIVAAAPEDQVDTTPQPGIQQDIGLSAEQRALLQHMVTIKVSPDVARELLASTPIEALQFQLDCLAERDPRDNAATFVKAVREGWEAPGKYVQRQEAAERAVRAKQHQEASRARKAAEQAVEREKQEVAEQEASQLDVIWEKLDPKTRQRIETEAKERLGVLGQMGRAQGALLAMRRNLLREMMGNTNKPTM